MKQVYLVYKTDSWHSYSSRDLLGVATTQNMAVKLCKKEAQKEGRPISDEQLWNLNNIKRTQGYSGVGEFQFEEVQINRLL